MTIKQTLTCTTALAALLSVPLASADVSVWLDPASPTVVVGETVDIDIMANFEAPVVAWGLDLAIGEPMYADWIGTSIGLEWDATDTLDEDGLAGLRFGDGVTGDVLLGTLTFEGLVEGMTSLTLSSGPEEDEGFLFETGELATNVQFTGADLTVIPEPGGLGLLILGALTAIKRRR